MKSLKTIIFIGACAVGLALGSCRNNNPKSFEGTVIEEKNEFYRTIYAIGNEEDTAYCGTYDIDPFNIGDSVKVTVKKNQYFDKTTREGWEQTENEGKYVNIIGDNGYQITEYKILKKAEQDSTKN